MGGKLEESGSWGEARGYSSGGAATNVESQ